MTQQEVAIPLTPSERDLIHSLRAIPDSALKRRILGAVDDLVRLGGEPRCAEAQADGVPCPDPSCTCDRCGRAVRAAGPCGPATRRR
jgi:hypothetical protein